jgi:hypothetical protein
MVREEDRGEGKLDVLTEASKLTAYTIKIVSNQNVFKPEYKTYFTDDIIKDARNIFRYAWAANNIRVRNALDWKKRKYLQSSAIESCESLIVSIQIAKSVYHLRERRIKYWGGKALNVKKKLKAWQESDTNRYG